MTCTVHTSDEKSICPGESIKLIKYESGSDNKRSNFMS